MLYKLSRVKYFDYMLLYFFILYAFKIFLGFFFLIKVQVGHTLDKCCNDPKDTFFQIVSRTRPWQALQWIYSPVFIA